MQSLRTTSAQTRSKLRKPKMRKKRKPMIERLCTKRQLLTPSVLRRLDSYPSPNLSPLSLPNSQNIQRRSRKMILRWDRWNSTMVKANKVKNLPLSPPRVRWEKFWEKQFKSRFMSAAPRQSPYKRKTTWVNLKSNMSQAQTKHESDLF